MILYHNKQYVGLNQVLCKHETLEDFTFIADKSSNGCSPTILFTENETNTNRLYNADNYTPYTKDAFHRYVINGDKNAISPKERGTKIAAYYVLDVAAGKFIKLIKEYMSIILYCIYIFCDFMLTASKYDIKISLKQLIT